MVFPFGLTNLHACLQMAKQTMGFCGQALKFRTDVKAFHLQVCSFVKLLNNYYEGASLFGSLKLSPCSGHVG